MRHDSPAIIGTEPHLPISIILIISSCQEFHVETEMGIKSVAIK